MGREKMEGGQGGRRPPALHSAMPTPTTSCSDFALVVTSVKTPFPGYLHALFPPFRKVSAQDLPADPPT